MYTVCHFSHHRICTRPRYFQCKHCVCVCVCPRVCWCVCVRVHRRSVFILTHVRVRARLSNAFPKCRECTLTYIRVPCARTRIYTHHHSHTRQTMCARSVCTHHAAARWRRCCSNGLWGAILGCTHSARPAWAAR